MTKATLSFACLALTLTTSLQPEQASVPHQDRDRAAHQTRRGQRQDGLVKPRLEQTVRGRIYADNWFAMYINGRLVAVDPIDFLPHNVVEFDLLPEYPMTIAILAKDNADPDTGYEYGDKIGDGGLILAFEDGTVSDAEWKARTFHCGPIHDEQAPAAVRSAPLPHRWYAPDFDDSAWSRASEYDAARIRPQSTFYDHDFGEAAWIWSEDLELDNTVIFRTRIERAGWEPAWNVTPDLDAACAPCVE